MPTSSGSVGQRVHVNGSELQIEVAALELGEVQEVVDETRQASAARDDHAQMLGSLPRQLPGDAVDQRIGKPHDSVEGCTKLVGGIREELVLQLVQVEEPTILGRQVRGEDLELAEEARVAGGQRSGHGEDEHGKADRRQARADPDPVVDTQVVEDHEAEYDEAAEQGAGLRLTLEGVPTHDRGEDHGQWQQHDLPDAERVDVDRDPGDHGDEKGERYEDPLIEPYRTASPQRQES